MNKQFVMDILQKCELWKEGQCVTFRHTNFNGNDWELIFRKEEKEYLPFKYSISGRKNGTHETISRRYTDAERAFLHVLNDFNENAMVKDRYSSLDEALNNL